MRSLPDASVYTMLRFGNHGVHRILLDYPKAVKTAFLLVY